MLDLTLRQLLEGLLHPGHREPLPGLLQTRFALLRHEGFVPRAEQVGGHGVQVHEPGRGRARGAAVPAAVQVAHGAHGGGEGGLVHHPGSEEFILAALTPRMLLLRLIVQPEAQQVCGRAQRRRVQVTRIQPGDAEPVPRLVSERHQRNHTVQRGRTRVGFPHGSGLEPAGERYRLGLGSPGHDPVDGESERLAAAAARGEHVGARGLAPGSRRGV